MTETPVRECVACGSDISHRRRQARTCGGTCRQAASRALKMLPCGRCGGPRHPSASGLCDTCYRERNAK